MGRKTATPPPVPTFVRWALRIGGGLALACGAILSFYALFGLATLNGWPSTIAWALPGSVDILTATALVVAMGTPRSHPGAKVAHWCAGISLVITVGCNVEYHALLPAHWSAGHIALVATGAVPALVVELILIMQMRIGDGATLTDADIETPAKTVGRKGKTVTDTTDITRPALADSDTPKPPTSDTKTVDTEVCNDSDTDAVLPDTQRRPTPDTDASDHPERSLPWWAEKAAPLYRQWIREHNGTAPKAPMLADLLIKAGYDVPAGEVQRRKIRAATETHITENPESEPEPDRVEVAA